MENYILERLIEIDEALGVKKRVRNGGKKIQRRFKFAKNKNQSFNNKTKKRKTLTASDRAKLSRTQKIAAKKRKSGQSIAKIKRKISNKRRKSLGFNRK